MAAALGHVWNPKECGDGSKPYDYHIWKNQHPLTSYFRYHPGARVLTHNHIFISWLPQLLNLRLAPCVQAAAELQRGTRKRGKGVLFFSVVRNIASS